MKILTINRGSSSIKCSLYDNFNGAFISPSWEDTKLPTKPIDGVAVIGHRIVHGGNRFQKSTLINQVVKNEIAAFAKLAPLHNANEVSDIEAMETLFPNAVQVAVFDTAFHHTLSEVASIYPLPYKWYEEGIKRYGFHGINFSYCTKRATLLLGKTPEKMVICHLGSGASLCAVKNGKSIDTTMGFTPLEGLMMDTRSGSIDPGILLHLLEKMSPNKLTDELYHNSGIKGVSGSCHNMKELLKEKTPRAKLTLDLYIHRLTSCIGSMVASLGGIDTLVFTGGIGETCPIIQQRIQENFSFLGTFRTITIPANESYEIANECFEIYSR